jgi:hypothetical protein
MGAWGTAISSNDTFSDIYGDFFDLYNDGKEVKEISRELIAKNQQLINDPDNGNEFWFALAKAQWECKKLDAEVFQRVKNLIESGKDIERWKSLGALEKDIEKRKQNLTDFLAKLSTNKEKAKLRRKPISLQPAFEKGECFAFHLDETPYGGAVVLEALKENKYGHNLIVLTKINQTQKPTLKDFENAEALVINKGVWVNHIASYWYMPISFKKDAHLIERIGKIDIKKTYGLYQGEFLTSSAGLDTNIIGQAKRTLMQDPQSISPRKVTIKELSGNRKILGLF